MVCACGIGRSGYCIALAVGAAYPAAVGDSVERQDMAYADVYCAGGVVVVACGSTRGRTVRGCVETICVGVGADGGLRRADGGAASHLHPHADRRLDRPCGRYRRRDYRTGSGGVIPLDEKAFFRL